MSQVKRLTLIRHAKSSWDLPELSDFDRPLNKRGKRNAPEMGQRLADQQVHPDLLVTSPARRALDTALVIAEAIGYPSEAIQREPRIYEASVAQLLQVIEELPADCRHAFLFGHNPGLTELANALTAGGIDNIPTCGVVDCELDISDWSVVGAGCGRLLEFDYPKKRSG